MLISWKIFCIWYADDNLTFRIPPISSYGGSHGIKAFCSERAMRDVDLEASTVSNDTEVSHIRGRSDGKDLTVFERMSGPPR